MKNTSPFFTRSLCDRCHKHLIPVWIGSWFLGGFRVVLSWFTKETICMACNKKEQDLRATLHDHGRDWEGCGYVPEPGALGVYKELFPVPLP